VATIRLVLDTLTSSRYPWLLLSGFILLFIGAVFVTICWVSDDELDDEVIELYQTIVARVSNTSGDVNITAYVYNGKLVIHANGITTVYQQDGTVAKTYTDGVIYTASPQLDDAVV